jgi:hypothetical protein
MLLPGTLSTDESSPATEYSSSTPLFWSRVRVIDESEQSVHFQIDRFGLLLRWLEQVSDIEPLQCSYPVFESTVRFVPLVGSADEAESPAKDTSCNAASCRLLWRLELKTRYPQLVAPLARWGMSALVDAVQGMLSEPRLFMRRMRLRTRSSSLQGVGEAMDAWLDFVWRHGGGLPTPLPPFILSRRTKDPKGREDLGSKHLMRRVIFPPGLVESIVAIDEDRHQVFYQVDNPGLFTYPVHTHQGRVRFLHETAENGECAIVMEWQVEIRPYAGFRAGVEAFTEAVINTLSRNLAVHLAEHGAAVRVSPPRGMGKQFASVRKDSWLGGVLHSHLSDQRSTAQQTLSMFQPWTWGRSEDDLADAAISVWSDGTLLDS